MQTVSDYGDEKLHEMVNAGEVPVIEMAEPE
jgi:hypothetical protein